MELDLTLSSSIIINVDDLKSCSQVAFKLIKQAFTYKNPKFIENEKWGYSNYNTPKHLFSYEIHEGMMHIARGGLRKVEAELKKFGIVPNIVDRTLVCHPVNFNQSNTVRRPDQEVFISEMKSNHQGCGIAYTSFGKCHEKGTKIVMFDGRLKKVEDIVVGDQIMGPDSLPRNVLSLGRGRSRMYQIVPKRGENFTVNEDHILCLKVARNSRHLSGGNKWKAGDIHNISVKEYINYSEAMKKMLRLWRTDIKFPKNQVPYDPYFIGLWLGDGSKREAMIYSADAEIEKYLNDFAEENELNLVKKAEKSKCNKYCIQGFEPKSNAIRQYLREFCITGAKKEKHIPHIYIKNDRNIRLAVLAGLIDSDGYLVNDKRTYEIHVKNRHLAEQVCFLARSLGFSCRNKLTENNYTKNSEKIMTGFGHRIYISGPTHEIPVLLDRKKAEKREAATDHLLSGFKVIEKQEDDYYGFTLDGDHLYLIEDCTVNHNTLSMLELAKEIKQPTLVLVHTTFLQEQWIEEATNPKTFNLDPNDIGGVGGLFGNRTAFNKALKGAKYQRRKFGKLNICLYHSMMNKEHLAFFKDKVGLVLFDEGQKSPIEGVQQVVNKLRARYRYAVSAQLKRKDGKEFLTFDTFGDVLSRVKEKNSDSKIMCKINLVPTQYSDFDYKEDRNYSAMITRMGRDKVRNILICRRAISKVKQGRLVIIFVERKEQAGILAKMLSKFRVELLTGGMSKEDIEAIPSPSVRKILSKYDHATAYKRIRRLAEKKDLDIIIGTQKAEVGLSIRTIGHGIITTPINNEERFKQIKGRVERTYSAEQEKYFGHKKPVPTLDVLVDKDLTPSTNASEMVKEVYRKQVTTLKRTKKTKTIRRRNGVNA